MTTHASAHTATRRATACLALVTMTLVAGCGSDDDNRNANRGRVIHRRRDRLQARDPRWILDREETGEVFLLDIDHDQRGGHPIIMRAAVASA